jgi:hydrogenase maturation protease
MKKVIVVGIGSRLMTDDGVGVLLVEDLAPYFSDSPLIKLIPGETDVDYCLFEM